MLVGAAGAQEVRIDVEVLGIGGLVRPGEWTPLRVGLTNLGSNLRTVTCEWELSDIDGDIVRAQRRDVTLNPGGAQQFERQVWLYGVPPINTQRNAQWRIRVLDSESGELLASQIFGLPELLDRRQRAVGICGSLIRGLEPYHNEKDPSRHELTRFITGLDLAQFPDRWYGLAALEAIVWNSAGAPPRVMPRASQAALREWVERGGHLVISMASVGDEWLSSPLADLLPVSDAKNVEVIRNGEAPAWLGSPTGTSGPVALSYRTFKPAADIEVLLTDKDNRPVVVTHAVGFGRVTLCGIDLLDPALTAARLPREGRIWNTIFGWRGPWFTRDFVTNMVDNNVFISEYARDTRELGSFVESSITLTEEAAGALVVAVLLFAVYFLVAGPISFAVLKGRGMLHHSWLVFAGVVIVFSVVTWSGALLLRPQQTRVRHVSFIDFDARHNLVRTRSWLTLFVADHGDVDVALDPQRTAGRTDLISSAGVLSRSAQTGFIDARRYPIDAGSPYRVGLPMRATARQLELRYQAPLNAENAQLSPAWQPPTGSVRGDEGRLTGQLMHSMPGTMTNVTLVYCPGNGEEPWAWRELNAVWTPGSVLLLDRVVTEDIRNPRLARALPLSSNHETSAKEPAANTRQPSSFLAVALQKARGSSVDSFGIDAPGQGTRADQRAYEVDMLSFFGAMPPPAYSRVEDDDYVRFVQRRFARDLDLTSQLATRCLIVIGHMDNGPLPTPLAVEGDAAGSEGLVIVRSILPIP